MKTLVVNLYAGPGTGKSTVAAHLFALLKWKGVNCELVLEYAKDKVWEESLSVLGNQPYVFGKQLQRLYRLYGKVDMIITDAPLGHSLYYGKEESSPEFKAMVLSEMKKQDAINIFLERTKPYNPVGRHQTEEQAKQIDVEIREMLESYKIHYTPDKASKEAMEDMADNLKFMITVFNKDYREGI